MLTEFQRVAELSHQTQEQLQSLAVQVGELSASMKGMQTTMNTIVEQLLNNRGPAITNPDLLPTSPEKKWVRKGPPGSTK